MNITFPCRCRMYGAILRRANVWIAAMIVFAGNDCCTATPLRLGMMGDSVSAGNGSANGEFPNWHTQLATVGRVTVGPTANQAVDGASSSDLAHQQGPIAGLVQTGQLDASVLILGGIDAVQVGYGLVLGGDPAGLPSILSDRVVPSIAATIAEIGNAGAVQQVVANIPDIVLSPLVQAVVQSSGTSPQVVAQFESAIGYTNQRIAADVLARGIPVLDLFRLGRDLAASSSLTLGGVTIADLFAPDGFHPAPIMHGLIANLFIEAMNRAYDAELEPLSDQQLLENAGYTPLSGGPTYFDVGPYVIVSEPGTNGLAILASAIIALYRRQVGTCRSRQWARPTKAA
ncbi:MAG: hypothetical protein IT427_06700 [Pirellulales bacterium]|nr:hypothetical protein [Pirellulales bacterium]